VTEQPQPPTPPRPAGGISKVWVLVVLAFGLLLGAFLAVTIPAATLPPAEGFGRFFMLTVQRALQLHLVLTTLEMVLLFSLVVVYLKIYLDTRANFSMGLLIVLFALLIHSILSYPVTVEQIGPVLLGSGTFFPYPDILTIIAYVIFLYLSLE
jgi:hypothetical protein